MARRPQPKTVTVNGQKRVINKAPNGEAEPFWHEKKQRWVVRYKDPLTGKRRQVQARTKTAAVELRAKKLEQPASIDLGNDPTIEDLAHRFLELAELEMRPNSLETQRKHVTYIVAQLGTLKASRLTIEHCQTFLIHMNTAGFAAATMKNRRGTLKRIAALAVQLGYLNANPVSETKPPKGAVKPKRVFDPAEQARLLEHTEGHRYHAVFCLMFHSGLRVSETLGLAWEDINPDQLVIHLKRACVEGARGQPPQLGPNKTRGTSGTVHISPATRNALIARKTEQFKQRLLIGEYWRPTTYDGQTISPVFTREDGRLVRRQDVDRCLRKACEAVGLEPVGTHTGRRSVVTTLWQSGASVDDIAAHVGHTDTKTTASYVADLGRRPQEFATKAFEILNGTNTKH